MIIWILIRKSLEDVERESTYNVSTNNKYKIQNTFLISETSKFQHLDRLEWEKVPALAVLFPTLQLQPPRMSAYGSTKLWEDSPSNCCFTPWTCANVSWDTFTLP